MSPPLPSTHLVLPSIVDSFTLFSILKRETNSESSTLSALNGIFIIMFVVHNNVTVVACYLLQFLLSATNGYKSLSL